MKNFLSYADKNGNIHEMNLNGQAVQVCMLEQTERELFVYNQFMARARRVAKYYNGAHDMDEKTAALYIASGLFDKFLQIRERAIEKADGVHYNAVEYCCMLKTFKQLKFALLRANCVPTTTYSDAYTVPQTEISFSNGKKIVIPSHVVNGKLEGKPGIKTTKQFDIIDVVEMWENRHSRKQSRLIEAINALNDERADSTVKLSLNEKEMNDDDKRAIRSKAYKLARDKNDLKHLTELNGNYGTPESDYLLQEMKARARAKLSHDKHYNDARTLVLSNIDTLSNKQQKILQHFRERNDLYYKVYDDKGKLLSSEPMTRDELITLFC